MTNVPLIAIVDDDSSVRRALHRLVQSAGYTVETFASARAFLQGLPPGRGGPPPAEALRRAGPAGHDPSGSRGGPRIGPRSNRQAAGAGRWALSGVGAGRRSRGRPPPPRWGPGPPRAAG